MKILVVAAFLSASFLFAQTSSEPAAGADPWKALSFLEGTWEAKTQGGSADAKSAGSYTFEPELDHHILARHSKVDGGCDGPATFDCQHGDLLYVYQDAKGEPLKAIYFDSEGHVIHYDISAPNPATAIFASEASRPGPQFRLVYELRGAVMSGKFQLRMPGQTEWKSYLEWSGAKK
jgi:hypothetical protein